MNRVLSLKSCQGLAQSPLVYLASCVRGWEFAADLPQSIGLCRNRMFKFLDKILFSLILDSSVFNKSSHLCFQYLKFVMLSSKDPKKKSVSFRKDYETLIIKDSRQAKG